MPALLLHVNLVGTLFAMVSALFALGQHSALANIVGLSVFYHYQAFRTRNTQLSRLAAFGVIAGLVELAADDWLVNGLHLLVYDPGGPFIWASPLYMPLSWGGMLLTFGVIGEGLVKKGGRLLGSLATATLMAIYVPFYELLAAYAGWWHYTETHAIGLVPHFIIVGEFLIGLPLACVAARVHRAGAVEIVALGSAIGLWIFVSYWIAYYSIAFLLG